MRHADPDLGLLRHLPPVDRLMRAQVWDGAPVSEAARAAVCRDVIAKTRDAVRSGDLRAADAVSRAVTTTLAASVARLARGPLQPVLNGLGVLVHTNAGRAPLSDAAVAAVAATSRSYCNLELDLATGARGSRQSLLRDPLRWLFGAEDALVVNNGAGAVMLALHALCGGRPALVSRGELVEIGGSFRVPDVMRAAGAPLVEVGTTNRTWTRDYAQALDRLDAAGTPAGAMLQIHRSNFRIQGFVHTPSVPELAELAHARGVPLVVDLGSGVVDDLTPWGLAAEPTVADTLAAGADLVLFSGDKLLGGPQAGLILGRRPLVEQLGRSPMARALRVDSMVLAALGETLGSHLRGAATQELPLWRAIDLPVAELEAAGQTLARELGAAVGPAWTLTVVASEAAVGGGAQPGETLPSRALAISVAGHSAARLATCLRAATPPLLARPRADTVQVDLRSLLAGTVSVSAAAAALTSCLVDAQAQLGVPAPPT